MLKKMLRFLRVSNPIITVSILYHFLFSLICKDQIADIISIRKFEFTPSEHPIGVVTFSSRMVHAQLLIDYLGGVVSDGNSKLFGL